MLHKRQAPGRDIHMHLTHPDERKCMPNLLVQCTRTCGLDDTPVVDGTPRHITQNAARTVRGARERANELNHRKGERLVFRSMYWES